jgi:hypothetical protein
MKQEFKRSSDSNHHQRETEPRLHLRPTSTLPELELFANRRGITGEMGLRNGLTSQPFRDHWKPLLHSLRPPANPLEINSIA